MHLLLTASLVLLVVLVAADVSAYESVTAAVRVTAVSWSTEGSLLATSAGFSTHTSRTFTLTLTCSLICYNFAGASVSPPFEVVGFSLVNQPIQYANVTLKAPDTSYNGPLAISLTLQ